MKELRAPESAVSGALRAVKARRAGRPIRLLRNLIADVLDAALTYVILATSGGRFGPLVGRLFARCADVEAGLERAAAYRLADRNVTETERRRVRRLLLRRAARRAAGTREQ
jgi:hypothetical protein